MHRREMITANECRVKASAALARADAIDDPGMASHWRKIGEAWLGVAVFAEQQEALAANMLGNGLI